jgi:hypothetical protein
MYPRRVSHHLPPPPPPVGKNIRIGEERREVGEKRRTLNLILNLLL